jgi:GT2 family glycosyltransferase
VGFTASEAPYVVFVDDDCIAHPELIARHHATLARASAPTVSLGPILAPPGRRYAPWTHWDADRLEREYARMARGECTPGWTHLYTGNVGVRRVDFAAVGGFDERFSRQEDIELGCRLARLGCRFAFDPRAVVWHDSSRSLRSWCQIPTKSAEFDVLIDQAVPGSGRLAAVRAGMGEKHWALRAARRVLRPAGVERGAVAAAIGVGCVLHAIRADRPSLAAFSLVWDIRYRRSLARALSAASGCARAASPTDR